MIARTWLVVGAALLGAALTSVATAPAAHAKKKKPSISCKTNRVGKFKTNNQPGSQPLGVTYNTANDVLLVVGGSAKIQGSGIKTANLGVAFSFTATIPDLESRTDFPVTAQATSTSYTYAIVRLVNPVAKVWMGDDTDLEHTMAVTVTGIKDGKISATFGGVVPVAEGDPSPLTISKGKVYAPITIQ